MVGPSYSGSDISARAFERILIIKPSSLGDILHALPVLRGLRARYPRSRIDWLVAPPFASIIEDCAELNETLLFDRKRFGRLGRSPSVTREFVRFLRDLRARRYDLVVDLQGLFRTGFFSWASGAHVRVGFAAAREGAWLFYTHRVTIDGADTHAVDRNYAVAGLLGFEEAPIAFSLALPSRPRKEAARLLEANGLTGDRRYAAVVPAARWETKVWAPERFVRTIDTLENDDLRCILLGGSDEVEVCDRIASACESAPANLAGKTSVPQFAALLETADVVLCHDSAAAHLAVALARPLVCITGPTNPRRTGPYRRLEDVIRVELDCAPCYLRRLAQCPHGHRCMNELDVEKVVSAVGRALEHAAIAGA